jgi:asparagine synthase (glutamine-hydrolysing)
VSAQFGRWNFDGAPLHQDYLTKVGETLAPYGPDGGDAYIKDNVGILYRAFHTTKESRKETQPFLTPSGAVLTWDGRLDNRAELIHDLRDLLTTASTDVAIVAASYERWGTACFAKLIGDWALSIWNPVDRSLILAKDPIGTRHLYYSLDKDQVSWSTILDPLVLLAGKSFALEEEYIAGWLSFFPATYLTPYVGIHSVPPSSSMLIREGKRTVRKYWDFDSTKRIYYRMDGEYEEHFRTVFGEAVRRRLRSDGPILAELSGGMDSSSIVCMADQILARGKAETQRLDTVSYYDDSEPNWNERPFFESVEAARGQSGLRIDVSLLRDVPYAWDADRFVATPAAGAGRSPATEQLIESVTSNGQRIVLSGIGGDEFLGGVSTPIPELADLLVQARFFRFAHQAVQWALVRRCPLFQLLSQTVREFLPAGRTAAMQPLHRIPWLSQRLLKGYEMAVCGYKSPLTPFGPRPSFAENQNALQVVRSQIANTVPSSEPFQERRYPYLDRTLLQFLFAIPREQLVRPGQRRSLMRRALREIVPQEILERRRKAFVIRSPLLRIQRTWMQVSELANDSLLAELQLINPERFQSALERAREGNPESLVPLLRALHLELWLRHVRKFSLTRATPVADPLANTPVIVSPANST